MFNFSSLFSFTIMEPYQGRGGGGGTCSSDPLIFFIFIPCFPLIKPLVPSNVLSSVSLDPKNSCTVPLIPKSVYSSLSLFLIFVYLFYLLFMVKKSLSNRLFLLHEIRSRCTSSAAVNCLSCLCDSDDFIDMLKHIKDKNKITFFKL